MKGTVVASAIISSPIHESMGPCYGSLFLSDDPAAAGDWMGVQFPSRNQPTGDIGYAWRCYVPLNRLVENEVPYENGHDWADYGVPFLILVPVPEDETLGCNHTFGTIRWRCVLMFVADGTNHEIMMNHDDSSIHSDFTLFSILSPVRFITVSIPSGWWFGTFFPIYNIWNVIIPIDELIFFRGGFVNHQQAISKK